MIAAVVPVRILIPEHFTMTQAFLQDLEPEVDAVTVFFNGGNPWITRDDLLGPTDKFQFVPAFEWPFYRMWNRGLSKHVDADAVLVLNNDIEWDEGALRRLAEYLEDSPTDVAIASPSPNGEPRHCFAIRPDYAPHIDERYQTWYGDTELELMVKKQGHRCVHYDPGIRHPHIQTTTDHIPGIHEMRLADQRLFDSKWTDG